MGPEWPISEHLLKAVIARPPFVFRGPSDQAGIRPGSLSPRPPLLRDNPAGLNA